MQPVDDRGREVARLLEGRYEVLGLLGRGGFAAVYQVRNLRLHRLEALKVVAGSHEENSEFIRRFEQESRVAASLEHPNILKVYDFGHDGGTLWYSMPFVDGPTLTAELVRRGTFEEAAAARIVVPLLDALEYSHGRGVIHRDIKPDNILLDKRDRPYLMDFGIAKTDDSLVKTQTGFVLGSPAYISPEQLRGERLDGRTDVYALGVSLFQMVAGSVPFKYDRMADLANRLVMDAPRLATRKPGVSPEMDRIVARSLARVRAERYADAREMRKDLEGFLDALRPAQGTAPVPAPDPASMENTAAVPVLSFPLSAPRIAPPPPPEPRVSAVVAIPATPPPSAPRRTAPAPRRSRTGILVTAIALGLVAIAAAAFLAFRVLQPAAAVRPSPPAWPTAAVAPTAIPAATPTVIPAPTAAAPPLPTAAAPAPSPAVPRPTARPTPARETAAAGPRRARTKPAVEELATLTLTPEQERLCGGKVVGVAVVVGEDGKLLSRRVISPSSATCDALALEVLARSRFRAALDEAGRPVEGRFAFAVPF
ncbi:MAG: protein kinase [Acidobacteriota bacterium]